MQILRKLKGSYALILFAATILSCTEFSFLGLLLSVFSWTWLSVSLFGKKFYGSYLTHFFIGLLLFFSFNSLLAIAFGILDIPVLLPYVVIANGVTTLLIGSHLSSRGMAANDSRPNIKPHWLLITSVVFISAFFAYPILSNPSTSNLLELSTLGYDDAAHFQMYRGNIANKGIITDVNLKKDPTLNLYPPIAGYPQALHFNLSLFARSLLSSSNALIADTKQLLLIYRSELIFVYAAIIALLAELVAQAVMYLRRPTGKLGLISQISIGTTTLLIYGTLIYPEIAYAGQTFLATIATLCATLLSLVMYATTKQANKRFLFFAACLFSIGVAYTWELSMVIAFAGLAIIALSEKPSKSLAAYARLMYETRHRFPLKQFIADNWAWIAIIISGLLILPQLYLTATRSANGVGLINVDGGVPSPDHARYLVLILALIVGATVLLTKKTAADSRNKSLMDMGLLFFSPILLLMLVYAVQTITTGQLTYYFTKTTYLVYITILMMVGVIATHILHKTGLLMGWFRAAYVGAILFGTLGIYLSFGRGFLVYAHGTNPLITHKLASTAGSLIDDGIRPQDIVTYTGRSYEEDMLFNLFLDELDQHQSPTRHVISIFAQQKRYWMLEEYLGQYTKRDARTYIIVTNSTKPSVQKALPADGNYKLIVID